MSLSPESLAKQAIISLKKHADPTRAKQVQKYFKEQVSVLGYTAATFRQVANELYEQIKPFWTLDEALAFCELMLPNEIIEEKVVSIFILERYIKSLKKVHIYSIKKWINRNDCDNWVTIDIMCTYIISPMIGFYPELGKEVLEWAQLENPWLRRASAVSFIKHVKKGQHIDMALKVAESLFSATEYLVQRANGWLLRDIGKTDMDRLEKFLLRFGSQIPRTTLRYAIEKFPEKKRKDILVMTRSVKN